MKKKIIPDIPVGDPPTTITIDGPIIITFGNSYSFLSGIRRYCPEPVSRHTFKLLVLNRMIQ